jgi:hypothetical protein
MAYIAQPEQQQHEWLDCGTLAMLLDGKATGPCPKSPANCTWA